MTNSASHIQTGKIGEKHGVLHLKRLGYQIIETNYRTRFGEIDCIAQHKGVLVFVEIKTRRSSGFGLPQEAVVQSKQKKMIQCAKAYVQSKSYNQADSIPIRFDVLGISLNHANQPTFELIENAIELA